VPRIFDSFRKGFYHAGTLITTGTVFGGKVRAIEKVREMKKEIMIQLQGSFEESAYSQNNVEYWVARDLQKLLDYDEWRNFHKVIDKGKTVCKTAGFEAADHFVDVNKMVELGSGSRQQFFYCKQG
jgi:hypothetical protein